MDSQSEKVSYTKRVPVDILGATARRAYAKRLGEIEAEEAEYYKKGRRINADWLMELDERFGVASDKNDVHVTGLMFSGDDVTLREDDVKLVDNEPLRFDGAQEWHAPNRTSRIGYRFVRYDADDNEEQLYTPFGGILDMYQYVDVMELIHQAATGIQDEALWFKNMPSGERLVRDRIRRMVEQRFNRIVAGEIEIGVEATRLFRLTYSTEDDRPQLDWFDSSDMPESVVALAKGVVTGVDYLDEMLLEEAGIAQAEEFDYTSDALCLVLEPRDDEDVYFVPIVSIVDAGVQDRAES